MRFTRVPTYNVPPGGWRWIDPKTHAVFKETVLPNLVERVNHFLLAQGDVRTIDEIEQLILGQLFYVFPTGFILCDDPTQVRVKSLAHLGVSGQTLLSGSRAAIEFVKNGGSFIPEEDAKSRAEVCKGCPFNQNLKTCSCSEFYKMLNLLLPSEKKDAELGVCTACGCSLQLKTNISKNIVDASNESSKLRYPPWCWQNKEDGR